MFSTTTIELSTSMPTASIRPVIDSRLMVSPSKYITVTVIRMHTGMAPATTRVMRSRRRKINSTMNARDPPIRAACCRLSMLSPIILPWLNSTKNSKPASSGSLGSSSSTMRSSSAVTSSVLAVDSL